MRIPLAKEGLVFILPSLALSLLLLWFQHHILASLCFLLCLFFVYFFRNPNRVAAHDSADLIAAADGKVLQIEEMGEEEFLKGRALRVTTFMGLADVHVNRSPCDAVVSRMAHVPGRYGLAFRKDVEKSNERNYILLEKGDEKFLLVQVAGFLARRIHCWIREKDTIKKGDPLGIIAFGSRVDVYIPPGYEIMVQLRQRVKSGVTPLARKKGAL